MLHRYLEYFKAIAEVGTVSGAAEAFHVSQPALSRSLKILEDQLGAELFYRDGRGMILSEYGKTLYRHVCFMEQEFHHAEEEIESIRGRGSQRIIVGAGLVWMVRVLPQAVARLRAIYPDTRIEVYAGDSTALLKEFVTGRYDLILCALENAPQLDGIACTPLIGPQFSAYAGRHHPIFDLPEEKRKSEIDRYDLAVYKSSFGDIYDPEDDFRMVSSTRSDRIVYVSTSMTNLFEVLRRTDLVSSMTTAIAENARRFDVIEVSRELRRSSFESGALYRANADNRRVISDLIECMDLERITDE